MSYISYLHTGRHDPSFSINCSYNKTNQYRDSKMETRGYITMACSLVMRNFKGTTTVVFIVPQPWNRTKRLYTQSLYLFLMAHCLQHAVY